MVSQVWCEKRHGTKEKVRLNHNTRFNTREEKRLVPGDRVYMTDRRTLGTVIEESATHSYNIQLDYSDEISQC